VSSSAQPGAARAATGTYCPRVDDPLERPEEAIRRVYAYVAYRIGPGPDAEDVTSATIERALRYRASFRRANGSPTAWLVGIAKRCLVDAADRRRLEVSEDEPDQSSGDMATQAATRVDLQRAVSELDDRSRDLVALRYGASLSSKEIARILGSTPNAVDVALHRTLRQLRIVLDPEGTDPT
jgi:RNA polymerase sigma-70 factor (ECF subfamily)